jgi:hypothetical protein
VVEIVQALPEVVDALRVRQLAAIRRFLEAVAANRNEAGVSGLIGSVRRERQRRDKRQAGEHKEEQGEDTDNT